LLVAPYPSYADILEQLETKSSNLEPKRLQEAIDQLKTLSDFAEKRVESCESAIRLIHEQMRDVEFEHKERERQAEQARRAKAKKEDAPAKNVKAKKRKDRPESTDGIDIKNEGKSGFSMPCSSPMVSHGPPNADCLDTCPHPTSLKLSRG
jgi:transcriptional adapter 3